MRKPRRTTQDGFTLVELSVYILILTIVLSVAFRLLISMTTAVSRADVRTQSTDQARLAVVQIDRQVRSGNVLYDPSTETDDPTNDIYKDYSLRVYTQANGEQKCVQWRINSQGELQTRSWSENWTVDGEVTTFKTVARNIVNKPGSGQPAFDSPAGFVGRLLDVKIVANVNSTSGKNATFQSTITGRNTEYGYSPYICNNVPPY